MPLRFRLVAVLGAFVFALVVSGPAAGAAGPPDDERQISALLFPQVNMEALRSRGPGVLPIMARLYERSDENHRTTIANAFYGLGWKSPDAKRVLMRDAHTQNEGLRLQVQWALGRVSNERDVIDVLLANMRTDPNPLFRDKAACALANDQIHLTDDQKTYLLERLIQALRDPEPQVRAIASQALRIQTGQTKAYRPDGTPEEREAGVREWERWLERYRANP